MDLTKLSNAEVLQVLAEVPSLLRGLVTENRDMREKIAAYAAEDRAEALVDKLEERGHDVPGETRREKVAGLLDGRDLRVMEAAVDMVAPDGSLVSVSSGSSTGAGSDLEAYILG